MSNRFIVHCSRCEGQKWVVVKDDDCPGKFKLLFVAYWLL